MTIVDPNYPTAPHWRGLYLAEMGRFDEAIASINQALEIDPRSPYIHSDLGQVLFYARRYDESLKQYRKTMEMAPHVSSYYMELPYLYEQMGMSAEWLSLVKLAGPLDAAKQAGFNKEGIKGFYRVWLENDKPAPTYDRAETLAWLGRIDEAIRDLNEVHEQRNHRMAQIKVNPVFDPLRSHPRFQKLLRRMNLAP